MNDDREFAAVEAVVRGSLLFRLAERAGVVLAEATRDSVPGSAVARLRAAWDAWSADARLRVVSASIAIGVVAHLILLAFVPAAVAPAVPKWWWALVAAVSTVAAILATD